MVTLDKSKSKRTGIEISANSIYVILCILWYYDVLKTPLVKY